VIDFTASPYPVRPDIVDRFDVAWRQLGGPGTWFDGADRIRLAQHARIARTSGWFEVDDPAAEVSVRIASRPATTTESWISEMVSALGNEERYVEVMGISARVVMADTFARLLGLDPFDFPQPRSGEPAMTTVDPRPKRVRSWISVGPSLVPPFTQILVPGENEMTYPLIEALYMTGWDMQDPDFRRGDLHRTQIELVAAALSFGNECFY
jgi:hypothetical protein